MSVIRKDLGIATAYGYAVSKGYTGTEEEFAELMASYATVAEEAQEAAEQATQAVQTAQAAVNSATTKAGEAATSASGAATSASQAGQSATAAAGSASTASAKAEEAGTSATNAAASETVATQAAQVATTKAGEASASATAASQSATAAAGSASDASDDADRAETAAGSVSAAAEQIATNTADIADLKDDLTQIEYNANVAPKVLLSDAEDVDLDVSDPDGNVLARFANGHIRTKGFNSANTFPLPAPIDSEADLAISDVNGNVIVFLENGQIRTKHFDSKYIRQLTGKKWACLGDSLTEHNLRTTMNYHDYIAEETGIAVYNLGHSGCGYAKIGGNGQNFTNQAANIPNDTDVITIFGSGNDSSAGLEIGEPTDTGTTTLCGYINTTLDIIYANHPTTPLGVITPTPWATKEPSDSDTWMKQYSEAIIAICQRRGIPYLDLWHCSNLHPSDANFRPLAYSKDDGNGVHPDEIGHAIIAPRFRQFLFTLI